MKIVILGAGGVGGYFGARLAAAGEDVHFVARGAHLEAMRRDGLRVESANGNIHVHPVRASDDASAMGPADVVMVAVKLYDTEAAAERCKALVGPDTTVVSFQNGVTAAGTFAASVGAEHVIGGVAYIMATIGAPGVITHTGTMARLMFGELDGGHTARVEALHGACHAAGFDADISETILADIWAKFTFLAPLSGITALTRLTIGPIRAEAETRALFRRAMDEVVALAAAKGIHLPADVVERHLERADGLPPESGSSMLHDLVQGKRLELAWLSGTVVALGREAGVATPIHETIHGALKPYADGPPG